MSFIDLSLGSMKLWKHLGGAKSPQPRRLVTAIIFLLRRSLGNLCRGDLPNLFNLALAYM